MSQDIEDTLNPRCVRVFVVWAWRPSGGLVVEGQPGEEFAGCLADDPDVRVLGEVVPLATARGTIIAGATPGGRPPATVARGAVLDRRSSSSGNSRGAVSSISHRIGWPRKPGSTFLSAAAGTLPAMATPFWHDAAAGVGAVTDHPGHGA